MITDPWFYAAAIPAVLLMGMSKSGFGAGFGALATPLVALTVPVPQAAAIMLPLLVVMDGFGLARLYRERDRALVKLLLPAGLLGTAIGTALFGWLNAQTVAAIVGALTLGVPRHPHRRAGACRRAAAAARARFRARHGVGVHELRRARGGPPLAFYVLPLKLEPLRFAATMAVFFAAVNMAKWLPYAWLGLIDVRNMATAAVLMPLAPVGVWIGLHVMRRLPARWFYRVFDAGMFATGCKLLWDGWR